MPRNTPIKKLWSKSRNIRVVTPSQYEKNDADIKTYWKNFIVDLELSYKDDKFWESNTKTVRQIVPPATLRKLAKVYKLSLEEKPYTPRSDASSLAYSWQFYQSRNQPRSPPLSNRSSRSISVGTTESSPSDAEVEPMRHGVAAGSTSMSAWSIGTVMSAGVLARRSSRAVAKRSSSRLQPPPPADSDDSEESASSGDDLRVHCSDESKKRRKGCANPHHEMLRTDKSESDMITWKSRYRVKQFEVSASDEFNKKADITTKKIAREFFNWYSAMGEVEFQSEIKRPEDIEQLFQVWFDEHASRGVVLEPRALPCVLQSIATACGVPEASCPNALKRQVAFDIHAESTPKHSVAFGTSLPQHMKHIPPDNNTRALWRSVRIPRDLSTMSCVWDDIKHLSSTKEFHSWLARRPHLPMPPCLRELGQVDGAGKKSFFVVPSDFVLQSGSDSSAEGELALPVSQLNVELKTVLSQLMNQ